MGNLSVHYYVKAVNALSGTQVQTKIRLNLAEDVEVTDGVDDNDDKMPLSIWFYIFHYYFSKLLEFVSNWCKRKLLYNR